MWTYDAVKIGARGTRDTGRSPTCRHQSCNQKLFIKEKRKNYKTSRKGTNTGSKYRKTMRPKTNHIRGGPDKNKGNTGTYIHRQSQEQIISLGGQVLGKQDTNKVTLIRTRNEIKMAGHDRSLIYNTYALSALKLSPSLCIFLPLITF